MPNITVSSKIKKELEDLKKEHEFKSLDAVVRYYLNSALRVNGGIFLGSGGVMREAIWFGNIRYPMTSNNYTNASADIASPIKFYQCLHCGNIALPTPGEPIVIPNCGCGRGMARITIKVEL